MENNTAHHWLEKIRLLEVKQTVRVMNVCGGHERTISQAGLRVLLPENIALIPGPGCPVCVCPAEDIQTAITLAQRPGHTLLSFGDMLRVPCSPAKGQPRSLLEARALGASVQAITSPMQAVQIARDNPEQTVIFFVAGFETTITPVAAMLAEGTPNNLRLLLSAKRTWPIIQHLLQGEPDCFDALIAPGHVATIMGSEEWRFVVEQHAIPTAIAGFTIDKFLQALYEVLLAKQKQQPQLINSYQEVVTADGNIFAKNILKQCLQVSDASWRGIGTIVNSGFELSENFKQYDAHLGQPPPERSLNDGMPKGCDCAEVLLGKRLPNQCRLYGVSCTPRSPIGPCMVSDEGACHIWWQH